MKTLEEQIANRCRHFNGISNGCCKAGIRYVSFSPKGAGGAVRDLPCLRDQAGTTSCEKASFPTGDEVAAEVEKCHERSRAVMEARAAIVKMIHGQRRVSGQVTCPVCLSGQLGFSVAYNGHIHAACSTPQCVRWME